MLPIHVEKAFCLFHDQTNIAWATLDLGQVGFSVAITFGATFMVRVRAWTSYTEFNKLCFLWLQAAVCGMLEGVTDSPNTQTSACCVPYTQA